MSITITEQCALYSPTGESVLPLLKSGPPLMSGFGVTHRLPAFVSLQELADSEAGD